MNTRLNQYFEFAANVWLEFAPDYFKEKFPRDFRFPVTVPFLFGGELPSELKGKPQLEVQINSYDKIANSAEPTNGHPSPGESPGTDGTSQAQSTSNSVSLRFNEESRETA